MTVVLAPALPRPRARDLDVMNGEFVLPRMAEIDPTSAAEPAVAFDDLSDEQLGLLHRETMLFAAQVAEAAREQIDAVSSVVVRRMNERLLAGVRLTLDGAA